MEIEGTRADTEPKKFTDFHIHYSVEGDLPEEKVIRAIQLSKDKYCSVSHSLSANIVASYSINGTKGIKHYRKAPSGSAGWPERRDEEQRGGIDVTS